MSMPNNDEWIEWHGGKRPVGFDAYVSVCFRNGEMATAKSAVDLDWPHLGDPFDIVKYEVTSTGQPAPSTRVDDRWFQAALQATDRAIYVAPGISIVEAASYAARYADALMAEVAKREGR